MKIEKLQLIITACLIAVSSLLFYKTVVINNQLQELQQQVQTLETNQSDLEDDVITAFEAQQTEMDAFIEFAEIVTDTILDGR